MTPQREASFRALDGTVAHPTVAAVHAMVAADMPMISLKTVYQTVHELAELGEVELLDLGTGAARVDPNTDPAHHHLVCRRCGMVRDLTVELEELDVPGASREGFTVERTQVIFRGLCGDCAAQGTFPTPTDHH